MIVGISLKRVINYIMGVGVPSVDSSDHILNNFVFTTVPNLYFVHRRCVDYESLIVTK